MGVITRPQGSRQRFKDLFDMRMMLEDDGTIEIIEIKIVRVRGRDGQALKSIQTQKNNTNTEKTLSVVHMGSVVVLSVAQLAVLLAGLVHHL